jgi:hypothetical protein
MVISLRLVQAANASTPMEVTLEGIEMLVRLLHPENILSPIDVTPDGIVILVRL